MKPQLRLGLKVAFPAVLWLVAVVRSFDTLAVLLAAIWTARIALIERKGYRRITQGWAPSKDPRDYY